MLDVTTRLTVLAEGIDQAVGPAVTSPAGDRLLVGGDTLRLFDGNGTLLREIVPPPGTSVTGMTWSPDGTRFVYIVGLKGYRPGV